VKTPGNSDRIEYKQISGGMLVQTRDTHKLKQEDLKVVTNEPFRGRTAGASLCVDRVKTYESNAIVYAREGQTVGVGAGQMSRVDSVKIGAMRARLPIKGSVLASDAFFPFGMGSTRRRATALQQSFNRAVRSATMK